MYINDVTLYNISV